MRSWVSFFKTNRIKDLVEAVRKDIRQLTTQATQSAKTYVMPESHQVHSGNSGNAVRKDIRHARITTGLPLQHHQILRLSRKIALQNFWQNLWKQVKRHFQCGDDPRMIREWSEHDPSMIRAWSENDPRMKTQTATRLANEVTFPRPPETTLSMSLTPRGPPDMLYVPRPSSQGPWTQGCPPRIFAFHFLALLHL